VIYSQAILRRWAGPVAAVVGTFVSCRQVVGISDNPPTDLVTSICGLPYGTSTCASCVNASCCTESNACAGDPVCSAYESCLGECKGDGACQQGCALSNPPGTAIDVSVLSACLANSCESACNLTCGALAGYAVAPDAGDSCQSCMATSACSQTQACATSANCDALNRCLAVCSTLDCRDECELLHGTNPAFNVVPDAGDGDAGATWVAFWQARSGACYAACGPDWECVGHVSWPTPQTAQATFNFDVKDESTVAPVQGANVTLCGAQDTNCDTPLAPTATTDGAGFVSLAFQNAAGAAAQLALGLNGFVKVTSPDLVPYYYYWGFPLSTAQIYLYSEVTTPTELQQDFTNVGVTTLSGRGTVGVGVYDCNGTRAAGVQVTLSSADGMTQSFTTLGVSTSTTDQSGVLVFANVPVGNFYVTATPTVLRVPSSQNVYGNVRAGATTQILVWPTP
jgi:hypothetical protein